MGDMHRAAEKIALQGTNKFNREFSGFDLQHLK